MKINFRLQHSLLIILIFIGLHHLKAQETTVRIVATSDIHGTLFPYDFSENRKGAPSLGALQTFVDSIRKNDSSNLILLENGDLLQGTPAAWYANYRQKSRQNLFARVINHLKYDAATIGNHDIETGPGVYYRLNKEFDFPYLGANIISEKTGEPAFKPYTIIERNGIKIAVIGLITPGVPDWLPKTLWSDFQFKAISESAEKWVAYVRQYEQPDAIVGLFHTGMGGNDENGTTTLPENAGHETAINVRGLDLVILGHDHRPHAVSLTNVAGYPVQIVNPGSHARQVGYSELKFNQNEDGKIVLKEVTGRTIPIENIPVSAAYSRQFRKDFKEILKFSNKRVATLLHNVPAREVLYGSSAFTGIIHDLQLRETGADISITSPLTISGSLDAGQLLASDFFKLYRYENFLYTMNLTGKEVHDFLEYSYGLWFNQMKSPEDHLLNFDKDENGDTKLNRSGFPQLAFPAYSFDSAAGINYEVDVSKPVGNRVNITGMEDGRPFSEKETYKVAINSYRGSGGGGHLTQGAGIADSEIDSRITWTSEQDIRTMLMDHFAGLKRVAPVARNNWKVVPADWAEKGREKAENSGF